jgi:Phage integrase, N-terminal SAM-like domain
VAAPAGGSVLTRRRGPGEGSITQRKDGRWQVRVELGKDELGLRQRKYLYAATQAEAVRLLKRAQRDKERGDLAAVGVPTPRTFGAWLDMWLETVRANKEPLTYRGYEMVVRVHLKPALGRRRLSQLGPLEIQRFLDAKRRTLAPGTVRRLWVVLTSALTRARKLGMVTRNVASGEIIEVPDFEQASENILTLAEARTFLAGIRGDRL